MVKCDLSRDYYGDLHLKPDADANEIKKQFKKLGRTCPAPSCLALLTSLTC